MPPKKQQLQENGKRNQNGKRGSSHMKRIIAYGARSTYVWQQLGSQLFDHITRSVTKAWIMLFKGMDNALQNLKYQ